MPTCPSCQASVTEDATFCGQCAEPLQPTTRPARTTLKWYHNLWVILATLFFVLGPFGLPLVWKHPRFSRMVKLVLTVVTLAYTGWLLKLTMDVVRAVSVHFEQYNSSFRF